MPVVAPPTAAATWLQLGSSALYAASAAGGSALFLLAAAHDPPASILLADTWSDAGAPLCPGWFVFLAQPIDAGSAQGVEATLRSALASPETTGFAWADRQGNVASCLPTGLDASQAPCVAAETTLPTPPGMLALSFPKDAPLRKVDEEGTLQAIACGVPPDATTEGATGMSASIQATGEAAGCITFEAFVGDPPGAGAAVVLMAVSIDPLHPFDPKRSFQRFTGARFGFAPHGDGWQLASLEGAVE